MAGNQQRVTKLKLTVFVYGNADEYPSFSAGDIRSGFDLHHPGLHMIVLTAIVVADPCIQLPLVKCQKRKDRTDQCCQEILPNMKSLCRELRDRDDRTLAFAIDPPEPRISHRYRCEVIARKIRDPLPPETDILCQ